MAEPVDRTHRMTVDDCAEISHAISAVLDVADPIPGAYALEVSSPGIDRPLVKPEHFERFKGERVRLETEMLVDGRRRFIGRLEGFAAGEVLVATEMADGEAVVRLPLAGLRRAKIVASEALMRAAPPPRGSDRQRKRTRGDGA